MHHVITFKTPLLILGLILLASIITCERFEPEAKLKVRTDSITSVTANTFSIEGNIIYMGESEIIQHGFCFSESSDPTIVNGVKNELGKPTSTGVFKSDFSNLNPVTIYNVRAYATDKSGTVYGAQKSFTTTAPNLPKITTTDVTNVTQDSAQSGGFVTDDGGASITARGVCWDINISPTKENGHTTDGTGTGTFTSEISGLECSTKYYIRAYATNEAGTGYGNEFSFITNECQLGLPTVKTLTAINVTESSATIRGEVSDAGVALITEWGIYYGTSSDPKSTGTKLVIGDGTGSFSSTITGLQDGTIYYFVAYAITEIGTAYGDDLSFETGIIVGTPEVETNDATSIGEIVATIGGIVKNEEGSSVFERGIYYSTSNNPQSSGTKVPVGDGLGVFSTILTGLSSGTTYYYVAYATNSAGTSYGSTLSFKTDITVVKPTVITGSASSILETSASVEGNVTADGGDIVNEKGFYYGTASNPQTTGTKIQIGNGVGTYSSTLTGLLDGVTYYYVAYAINSAGTSFGLTESFVTQQIVELPSVTTIAASSINESSAIVGGNVTNDGGGAVNDYGVYYGTSADPLSSGIKLSAGSGTGVYYTPLTGLGDGVTYYFIAYATNSAGTSYGSTLSFETDLIIVSPTVNTLVANMIGETGAEIGGNVTNEGGGTVFERGIYYGTGSDPVSSGTKIQIGDGIGGYTYNLTDLSPGTIYFYAAYAINSAGTTVGSILSFTTDALTVTDYDGNVYQTVQIGLQIWMGANLKTTHYADGSPIQLVESTSAWDVASYSDKAYCWYDNSNANRDAYGGLYTWAAAMNGAVSSNSNPSGIKGVCPDGWHLPSDEEWKELEMSLGMSQATADLEGWRGTREGAKLKEAGITNWDSPNIGATNESGFTALPAGLRTYSGAFGAIYSRTYIWSATATAAETAMYRRLEYNNADVQRYNHTKDYGLSVRCLKD